MEHGESVRYFSNYEPIYKIITKLLNCTLFNRLPDKIVKTEE